MNTATKMGRPARPLLDRFVEKFDLNPETGCWVWKAGKSPVGYGIFVTTEGKTMAAHRAAYDIFIGPLTTAEDLHHKCKCRLCVNPEHLIPVSRQEHGRHHANTKTHCINGHEFVDGSYYMHSHRGKTLRRRCRICDLAQQKQRIIEYRKSVPRKPHASSAKTHCKRGHEFSPENTRITRAGGRQCRICFKMLQERWKSKNAKKPVGYKPKTHCKHGHEMTPENTYIYRGRRSCRVCIFSRIHKSRQNKKSVVLTGGAIQPEPAPQV